MSFDIRKEKEGMLQQRIIDAMWCSESLLKSFYGEKTHIQQRKKISSEHSLW